uniref:Uncharacterized protein AlNc14C4G620 n=1 Tax=Albugo laibachii Nc14 TaxID=890382 RepID=F0W0H8_9STRA|nr:conserved hypothetical protein [Albugo laibachii Nc14]|eukprot:CCA14550.1 conserved hypothetical protein [Albugo laibachii Nc14]
MTSEVDVVAMAEKIKSFVKQENWETSHSNVKELQNILNKLTMLKVDMDLLKRTNIGKMVNRLKKHQDSVIRGYSSTLTKKWKEQVGVLSSPQRKIGMQERNYIVTTSKQEDSISMKYEKARKKIQENYANEKAKKSSRTIQMLNGPIAKRTKGTKISAMTSARTFSTNGMRFRQHREKQSISTSARVISASRVRSAPTSLNYPSASRGKVLTTESSLSSTDRISNDRRLKMPMNSRKPMSAEERHAFRMSKYQALSATHTGNKRSESHSTQSSSVFKQKEPVDARKAYLDKKYPRVFGSTSAVPDSLRTAGPSTKTAPAKRGVKSKAQPTLSEGQREVIQWLRGLPNDMSEYATAFFENGFDSIHLLSTIEKSDVPGLVPKKGHHRMIVMALESLKKKSITRASAQSRSKSLPTNRKASKRKAISSDIESDDSFVINDGDDYAPGAITAMFRKNRHRNYSYDSEDSLNMEASYADIQREEERSARYGEYEDLREELRNERTAKRSKTR